MKNKKFLLALITITIIASVIVTTNNTDDKSMQHFLTLSSDELEELPKYDRPDLADLQNFEMTKDISLGYPPSERLFESYNEMRTLISRTRMPVEDVNWTERGPNNFGGRTRAIMFDPNDAFSKKMWAAGVGGGLWVNDDVTNSSSSWKSINDFFGNIAITAMDYDPTNRNTFYFGTGEGWGNADAIRGNGIWKSTDGGASWNNLSATAGLDEFRYVNDLIVTKSGTVLAATRESGGIVRSSDGGVTWDNVISAARGADLEKVGDIIYATTGQTGTIWKSVDDGITWSDISPQSGTNRIEIGVHENHPNTVYAVAGQGGTVASFHRSFDAGVTWSNVDIPPYHEQGGCAESTTNDFARGQAWYDLIIAVDPQDKNALIVGGIDLYKSTNAGSDWDLISYWTGECDIEVHADQHNFIFRPGYPNEAISANDGGLYYTNDFNTAIADGGPSWTPRNNDYNVAQFYACAMINEAGRDYYLAGAQDNGSHQFFNPGINSTNEITGGDGSWCFIDQDDPNIQITSFTRNAYNITKDFWDSNQRAEVSGTVGRFINPADYNSNTNTMFAAGNEDEIVRYAILEDEDTTPERLSLVLDGGTISTVTISKDDDDVVFVGTGSGKIYKLTDVNGAPVASEISTTEIEVGVFISSIAIGADDDQLIATASNYGAQSVYASLDGGASWSTKEGNLPDMPVRWSLFNPNNLEEVLLATELGVWYTSDFSSTDPTWVPANEGLANVRCDMIRYRDSDGMVAVATHGRGLYTSDVFAISSIPVFSTLALAYSDSPIEFNNYSIKASSYSWDFGDNAVSTDENPIHTYATAGTYSVTLEINGDPSLTETKEIRVLPYLETDYDLADGGDFESNTDHFHAVTIRGTGFELGNSSVAGKDGTNSGNNAWVTDIDADEYAASSESYLYTPLYDFSLSGAYTLSFYTKYAIEDEWEGFILEYTLDNGVSWLKLGDYLDEDNWYNQVALGQASVFTPGEPLFSGDTGGEFVLKTITISDLSNQPFVGFRFAFRTDTGTEEAGIAIDDFSITAPSETAVALAFTSSSDICSNGIVTFENSSTGSVSEYLWEFGSGAFPAMATGFGPHEVIYSTSGDKTVKLTASTDSEDVIETNTISINELPQQIDFDAVDIEICSQETTTISIASPQSGITYYLYDVATNEREGEGILSDGSSISFTTKSLSSGLAEYKIQASNNGQCDLFLESLITINVKENPEVVIIQLSNLLISSPGDAYQWYRDDVAIDGANNVEYSVNESGTYRVEVNYGDCISVSPDLEVLALSLESEMISSLYPNPVVDILNISFKEKNNYSIVLYDMAGAMIFKENLNNTAEASVDLSTLEAGFYHIVVTSNVGLLRTKLIKK